MEKLLLVDDEEWILDGLKLILPWNDMGIYLTECAFNGLEAIKIIEKEQPSIILTDIRMPITDGLELAKYVFENNIEAEVIIISGYSDFEYARQAVAYNVSAYLTKPIDCEELTFTIENIIKKVQKRREQAHIVSRFEEMESNQRLSKLYLSKTEKESIIEEENIYWICVFCVTELYAKDPKISDSSSHFLHLVKKSEWCGNKGLYFRNSTNPNHYIFIANFNKSIPYKIQYNKILQEFDKLLFNIKKEMYIEGSIGISDPYTNTNQSFKAYLQASFITENIVSDTKCSIISNEIFETNYQNTNILNENIRQLAEAIENGYREDTGKILDTLTNYLIRHSLITIRINIQEVIIVLSSLMMKYNGSMYELNREYADVFRQIWHVDSGEKIIELGTLLVEAVFDYIQSEKNGKKESLFMQIKRYIDDYYYEPITLNDMAKKYFMNVTYFSRKFKHEIGVNFNDYVRNIRLQKAAELLLNTDLKVYEIAQKVGFDNENYFMKKFREEYGITPSLYREKT